MLTLSMLDPQHAFTTLCAIGMTSVALALVLVCLIVKP